MILNLFFYSPSLESDSSGKSKSTLRVQGKTPVKSVKTNLLTLPFPLFSPISLTFHPSQPLFLTNHGLLKEKAVSLWTGKQIRRSINLY